MRLRDIHVGMPHQLGHQVDRFPLGQEALSERVPQVVNPQVRDPRRRAVIPEVLAQIRVYCTT